MKQKARRTQLSLYLTEDEKSKLTEVACKSGITLNKFMRDALFAAVDNIELDKNMDMSVWGDMYNISSVVSRTFSTPIFDIVGKSRRREIVVARHIIFYFACKYTDMGLISIGEFIGNRDHSTVINARNKVTYDVDNDFLFFKDRNSVRRKFYACDRAIKSIMKKKSIKSQ